jgi:nitrate reductase gamma subunit
MTIGPIKKALTQEDDDTYDIGALTIALGFVMLSVFQAWAMADDPKSFSAMSFGGAIAAILTAGGAQLLMRKKSDQQTSGNQ